MTLNLFFFEMEEDSEAVGFLLPIPFYFSYWRKANEHVQAWKPWMQKAVMIMIYLSMLLMR